MLLFTSVMTKFVRRGGGGILRWRYILKGLFWVGVLYKGRDNFCLIFGEHYVFSSFLPGFCSSLHPLLCIY